MTISKHTKKLLLLCIASLGIVYGDIGTSPLYAFNEIYNVNSGHIDQRLILGSISLIFWVLTLMIAFKYIVLVLKADNDGEGGVFALFSLFKSSEKQVSKVLMTLLVLSAGFLFGDGIITPAISVVSAVEGLNNITTTFKPFIVPISITILTGLFIIQKKGSFKLGHFFGPVTVIWFSVIAILGFIQIVQYPAILMAINPLEAIDLLFNTDLLHVSKILSGVILVITGGEALYADMGHFGRFPIRISWFAIVYPALLLNYFGQGAYVLSKQEVLNHNVFFSMVPDYLLYPMVILATLATIIASQALISGVFSLTMQAVSLGLFPHLKIKHTNEDYIGQIYVPVVNWTLYLGTVILILFFKSSANLAIIYGFAVSGAMFITSIAVYRLAVLSWGWNFYFASFVFVPLISIDIILFLSNSLKILSGGYIALLVALLLLFVVKTWEWGKRNIKLAFASYPTIKLSELIEIKEKSDHFMPKTAVIMTPQVVSNLDDKIPPLKQIILERYGFLPMNIIFLSVVIQKVSHYKQERYVINTFYDDVKKGTIISIKMNFGYMENPRVEGVFQEILTSPKFPANIAKRKYSFHVMYERIRVGKLKGFFNRIRYRFFKFLARNMYRSDHYFGLGRNSPLSVEMLPVNIK